MFRSDDIRNEIKALKKEYKTDKKSREVKDEPVQKAEEKEHDNEIVQSYLSEQRKYSNLKKDIPKKGAARLAIYHYVEYVRIFKRFRRRDKQPAKSFSPHLYCHLNGLWPVLSCVQGAHNAQAHITK